MLPLMTASMTVRTRRVIWLFREWRWVSLAVVLTEWTMGRSEGREHLLALRVGRWLWQTSSRPELRVVLV